MTIRLRAGRSCGVDSFAAWCVEIGVRGWAYRVRLVPPVDRCGNCVCCGCSLETAAPLPGDRVKTDARDAFHLARLLKLDEVVAVHVPSVVEESARDLVRSREDTRQELMGTRHRLSKLLLRHGFVYCDGQAWTQKHDLWLRRHRPEDPVLQITFDANYEAVLQATARRDRLDDAIGVMAAQSQFTPLVDRMGCLRGIGALTGFALAVEISDWHRFTGTVSPATPSVRSWD